MRAKAISKEKRFIISKISFGIDHNSDRLSKKEERTKGKEFKKQKPNIDRYLVFDSKSNELLGFFYSANGDILNATELHYVCYSDGKNWFGCFGFNMRSMQFESCGNSRICKVSIVKDNKTKIDESIYQKL